MLTTSDVNSERRRETDSSSGHNYCLQFLHSRRQTYNIPDLLRIKKNSRYSNTGTSEPNRNTIITACIIQYGLATYVPCINFIILRHSSSQLIDQRVKSLCMLYITLYEYDRFILYGILIYLVISSFYGILWERNPSKYR